MKPKSERAVINKPENARTKFAKRSENSAEQMKSLEEQLAEATSKHEADSAELATIGEQLRVAYAEASLRPGTDGTTLQSAGLSALLVQQGLMQRIWSM